MLQLLITRDCNNKCEFCATGSPIKEQFSLKEIQDFIVEYIQNNGTLDKVVITGGEPTLHPKIIAIVSLVAESGFQEICIMTNARSARKKEFAYELRKAGANSFLCSIYGHTPEIHDQLTGKRGSFNQTVIGIQNLINTGAAVEVRGVLNKIQCQYIEETTRFVYSTFPDSWRVGFVTLDFTDTALANASDIAPTPDALVEAAMSAIDIAKNEFNASLRIVCAPLCIFPYGYWPNILGVQEIPESMMAWDRVELENRRSPNIMIKQCEECDARLYCTGIPRSYEVTYKEIGKIISPVHFENWKWNVEMLNLHSGRAVIKKRHSVDWVVLNEPIDSEVIAPEEIIAIDEHLISNQYVIPEAFSVSTVDQDQHDERNYLATKLDLDFYIFNMSNMCNLDCTYCYVDKRKKVADPKNWEKISKRILDISPSKRLKIEFHGGEPLLAVGAIKKVVDIFGDRASYSMVTNATLMDSELAALLAKIGATVTVSLDGPKDLHDECRITRKGKGTYEQVIKGIFTLQQANVDFGINAVVPDNRINQIKRIYDECCKLAVKRLRLLPMFSEGREYPVKKLNDAIIDLSRNHENSECQIMNLGYPLLSMLDNEACYLCDTVPCGAGNKMLTVDGEGEVYLCHKLASDNKFRCANVFDDDVLRKIRLYMNSTKKHLTRNRDGECGDCFHYDFCGGVCFAEKIISNKEYYEKDNDCCKELFDYLFDRLGTGDSLKSLFPKVRGSDYI